MSQAPPRPPLSAYVISSIRFVLIICSTVSISLALALTPQARTGLRAWLLRAWGRSLTWLMGLSLSQEGAPPREGMIMIANHTSYADIPILMGVRACSFLAKAEVARWPVIGWGARVAGTVFVDRSSPESRVASREELKRRVNAGAMILVFSEGTTTPRGVVEPLKPGMFHEAASARVPIQLVSLEYGDDGDAWVGDDPLWPHFVWVFGRLKTNARLCYRAALLEGDDGHALAEEAERWLKGEAARASSSSG